MLRNTAFHPAKLTLPATHPTAVYSTSHADVLPTISLSALSQPSLLLLFYTFYLHNMPVTPLPDYTALHLQSLQALSLFHSQQGESWGLRGREEEFTSSSSSVGACAYTQLVARASSCPSN